MAINAKAVIRVIIEGEWIWVERGTFTVVPLEFSDDEGAITHVGEALVPAYFFTSTQGDPYFGPLSSISLFKLDNQILEESEPETQARGGRPAALPEGSGETFGGEMGPRREEEPTIEPPPKKAVPLFADDVDEDDDDELFSSPRSRGGGLF